MSTKNEILMAKMGIPRETTKKPVNRRTSTNPVDIRRNFHNKCNGLYIKLKITMEPIIQPIIAEIIKNLYSSDLLNDPFNSIGILCYDEAKIENNYRKSHIDGYDFSARYTHFKNIGFKQKLYNDIDIKIPILIICTTNSKSGTTEHLQHYAWTILKEKGYQQLLKMDAHAHSIFNFFNKKVRTRIYYDPEVVELIFNKPNIMKKLHNSSLVNYDTKSNNSITTTSNNSNTSNTKSTTSNNSITITSNNSNTQKIKTPKIQIISVIKNNNIKENSNTVYLTLKYPDGTTYTLNIYNNVKKIVNKHKLFFKSPFINTKIYMNSLKSNANANANAKDNAKANANAKLNTFTKILDKYTYIKDNIYGIMDRIIDQIIYYDIKKQYLDEVNLIQNRNDQKKLITKLEQNIDSLENSLLNKEINLQEYILQKYTFPKELLSTTNFRIIKKTTDS
jgi:hypothetical protein